MRSAAQARCSEKVRASRFEAASGVPRVSVVCQDSFFKGVPADAEDLPWDEPESLDHDLVLSVLKAEAEDKILDCLIFRGLQGVPRRACRGAPADVRVVAGTP